MSDAAERLQQAEAWRAWRGERRVHVGKMIAICAAIRDGLKRLGYDPTRAAMLMRYEAQTKNDLEALMNLTAAPPDPFESAAGRQFGNDFVNLVRHYRDPASPAPDLADESVLTLWTFVLGRAPEAFAPLTAEIERDLRARGALGSDSVH